MIIDLKNPVNEIIAMQALAQIRQQHPVNGDGFMRILE
jgi:hypothetical protein